MDGWFWILWNKSLTCHGFWKFWKENAESGFVLKRELTLSKFGLWAWDDLKNEIFKAKAEKSWNLISKWNDSRKTDLWLKCQFYKFDDVEWWKCCFVVSQNGCAWLWILAGSGLNREPEWLCVIWILAGSDWTVSRMAEMDVDPLLRMKAFMLRYW